MKRKSNTLLSLVLPAVLCTALWGSAAPCVKKGYELFEIAAGDSFSQLVFAGWRFTLAGVLVLLVAACMGHRIRPKRGEYRAIFMISLFQSMLQYVCYYIGLAGTTGTKASVLSGTQTFFALLLAHALLENDRLTRRKTLGCVLGFAGVLVLGLGGLDGFRLHGDGLILLSAVSAGAGALVSRIYTPGRDPMLLTGWQLALGGTFLGLLGRVGGGALGSVTAGGAALLGYMIVLSAAAFTIWTALLGRFPVGRVSLFENALQDGTVSPEQSLPSLAGALVRPGRENNQSAVRKVGVTACVYPAGPPKRCTVRNVSGFALRSVHVRIKQ